MNKKLYLVTVLIEYSAECITDAHSLHVDYEKAKGAMAVAIEEAAENFDGQREKPLAMSRPAANGATRTATVIPWASKNLPPLNDGDGNRCRESSHLCLVLSGER